ncbi:hypothetical protein AJ78_04776 [Emergomyces pasteurianus Ep9510]|uniref:Hydrophobin n=1 Tax=Emergomyces pasteurianus Ep9510 TaxID=1447872 RepID=A0A1J9QIA6_9EURO|nr:hypothetical protein AJ78_04776 [Emergomyces pasteurianus Ep9510]
MRADSSSSTVGAVIALLATAAFISSVSGVWTCPSEREPFCCGKYSRVNESSTVLIGFECVDAPRNDNCTDGRAVECCKPMKPRSPNDPHSPPDSTADYYCDSKAVGYGLHQQG